MKKAKNKIRKRFFSIVIISIALIILTVLGFFTLSRSTDSNTNLQIQFEHSKYDSRILKINFIFSSEYTAEEQINRVILSSDKGQIVVDKIGTNFENLYDYLNDVTMKNRTIVKSSKETAINGLVGLEAIVYNPERNLTERSYYFYPTQWVVYVISTDSEALYDDLDQIAQSFRYIP